MEEKNMIRVGITHGDANGVGYELILKTFADEEMFSCCVPVVYGSPKTATYHRKAIDSQTNFTIVSSGQEAEAGRLNLVSCYDEEIKIELGQPSPEAGRAARLALERATQELKEGKIDVLVTAPINKATIKAEEFPFVGHTEYLEACLGGDGHEALMILVSHQMRVALVTTHLAIRDVADAITPERVEHALRLFVRALRRDFLLSNPRIAVLGLNPHNGDGGTIGKEDAEAIAPVVRKLAAEGLPVFGPYAADGFFGTGQHRSFDGVLAMYHDQGLIPFKAFAMEDGVNYTAGLPFVRTSPDHGTAYEIAGRGEASEESFRNAIFLAIDIYRNRICDDEATANPLPKFYRDRREDERPRRFPREREERADNKETPEA
ncbi:MAG: 4-hydroxythreonine-4-phosphate dehydrogenase PdxA [Prevotella sp.]|nr:4-hydroxythreonine-4-phosphate dehydrogenase PdxA [Prevotella sp.]